MEQSTKYFLLFITMYASQCVNNNQLELNRTINRIFLAFFIAKYASQCVNNNQLEIDRTINQILCVFSLQSMPSNVYTAINWNSMEQSTKYFLVSCHKVGLPMCKQQSTGTQQNNQPNISCFFITKYDQQNSTGQSIKKGFLV